MNINYNINNNNENISPLSLVVLFFITLIAFYLQVSFIKTFSVFNTGLNLILITAVVLSVKKGDIYSFFIGLFTGVMLDIYFKTMLMHTLIFVLLCILFGYIGEHLARRNLVTVLLSVIVGTLIFELTFGIIFLIHGHGFAVFDFLKILLQSVAYNAIWSIPIYALLYKV